MRKLIVLSGIVLLCAGAVRAQENELVSVLATEQLVMVDSVELRFPRPVMFPTPGFGGEQVEDTFGFGQHPEFAKGATVHYSVDGEPVQPLVIEELNEDEWYELEGYQPGRIKFVFRVGGIEEGPWHAVQVRMSAYPNPFAHRTRLSARLTRAARVFIDLFDESGIKVRSLAAGEFAAGDHHWSWDGRHTDGRRLASGVYLVRLAAGDERSLVKLILTD